MGKRNIDPLPKEVDQLKLQVQEWRRSKTRSSCMPREIWDAAIRLAKRFGVCRISRAVGLDYGWLRKKAGQLEAQPSDVLPTFLELPVGIVVAEPLSQERGSDLEVGCLLDSGPMIDISTPDGARMRIRLEAGRSLDAAGIVAAFLGPKISGKACLSGRRV